MSPARWWVARGASAVLALAVVAAAPLSAQMPDLRQMNGMALPSQDLPDGSVSVRVLRQTMGNNVVGAQVTVTGDGVSDSAPTDESGRAIFAGLGPGKVAVATVTVDGEALRSQPFEVPRTGGLRVILVSGLSGAPAAASPDAAAAPATPAEPAKPGTVVLGTQWRTIVDFAEEKLEIFHIFEFVNATATPVSVEKPLEVALPADAEQATLLEGSSSSARIFERKLVVAGPFASGRTIAQVAYRLPISGGRREIAVPLPVASLSTNVILRRLGETRLVAPTLPQAREADAEGKAYWTGTGPGMKAGETLTLVVEGIPHHPAWPRYTALGLAGLVVVAGLWLIFRVPVDPTHRIKALEAQRTALLTRLQRLEQGGEPATEELREERDAVLRDLEGVYALLDAERVRAGQAPAVRQAS
ncbi:carboxypeptidase-like regulatory domain-containing protein [Luteitalea sp.]|uniref:carboxypeptidase-like regulatory domain-containing protein n=1 Tax=Luteitalea sp. TaxID=2004800 RepID=UPI0037C56A97